MKTFYCGCDFSLKPKRYKKESCGIVVTKYVKATGIDAEHVMPISLIGYMLDCWADGGRKNCGRVNNFFRMAEGDLHNLVPSVPTINRLRSNYPPIESIASRVGRSETETHQIFLGKWWVSTSFLPTLHLLRDFRLKNGLKD
jgi:endonuclease I